MEMTAASSSGYGEDYNTRVALSTVPGTEVDQYYQYCHY